METQQEMPGITKANGIENQARDLPRFLQEPDDKYACVQCEDTLRPPVKQTMCGHRLCAQCVTDLFRDTETPPCPANEDCLPLQIDEIHPDVATTKELQRMRVYCPFKENGCTATPKWSAVSDHEATCDYATQQCQNPGCDVILLRHELNDHQLQCEYSQTVCEQCDERVSQKDLQNGHEKTCCPKPKKCPYTDIGCTFEGTPDKLKLHAIDCAQNHDQQLIKTTSKVKHETVTLKQQLNDLLPQINDLKAQMDALQVDTGDKQLQVLQRSVAKLNEDIIKIKEETDQKLQQQHIVEFTSKLGDIQSVASMHESRIGYLEQGSGGPMSEQMMRKVSQVETSVGTYDVRLAEDDVRFRLLETAAFDGQLIWKITNYQKRKKDAEDGRTLSLYSQPFYTSYYGYKMCARAYLNGDGMGRGTHLSLFFVVMRGEYDALLPWPFRPKVTLALLDQSGSRRHIKDTFRPDPTSTSFRRPVSEMNIASGSPMFAALSTVESDSYLRNDTLFVRVTIDQSDLSETFA